jgi:hypothetical protein
MPKGYANRSKFIGTKAATSLSFFSTEAVKKYVFGWGRKF